MKIIGVGFCAKNLSFERALKSCEEKEFAKITKEAEKALGIDDGVHLFKVFQTSLPTDKKQNLGIGKINSDEAMNYLDFMSLYTGSNAVKIYPVGQIPSKLRFDNYYCPYERSATVVGEDNINFFKLAQKEYGNLLNIKDIRKYTLDDDLNYVDYENELDSKHGVDSKLVKKAYENLQTKNTPEAQKIGEEFLDFKNSQKSDTLERLAIAPFVRESDEDLFFGIETSKEKQERFENYKKQYEEEIDIFKFGKFLALKNLKEAKKALNDNNLELYGDCPIGFSKDEVFAFPEAFYPENITPGWGFRAIKYEDIPKEGTLANRLFKEKISWHIQAFDGIRFDVGWQYFSPKLMKFDENGKYSPFKIDIGDKIIKFIEQTAKSIKGENYNTKKLMYECDAGADDFQMFDWNNGKPVIRKIIKGRTPVLTSVYEHANGYGWATPAFFKNAGMKDYMYGTNNHDSTPLRILAQSEIDDKGNEKIELSDIRQNNIKALHKSLKINIAQLLKPKNFIKAKFAQLFLAKNHFVFFNDVMGSKNRMDKENSDPQNYRFKIQDTYEKEFHTALQKGYGFNLAENLRLAMKAKNLDKTNPKLYKQLKKYSEILYSKGPKTKQEAQSA